MLVTNLCLLMTPLDTGIYWSVLKPELIAHVLYILYIFTTLRYVNHFCAGIWFIWFYAHIYLIMWNVCREGVGGGWMDLWNTCITVERPWYCQSFICFAFFTHPHPAFRYVFIEFNSVYALCSSCCFCELPGYLNFLDIWSSWKFAYILEICVLPGN